MARVNLHNSNALMAAYHQSRTIPPRKKPPRQNYGVTGSIPGFGAVRDADIGKRIADAQARNDAFPYPRNVFRPKRRGPTRPTPGSRRQPRRD